MKRRVPVGEEVVLLASSDAFGRLSDELATAHEQWRVNGAEQPTLERLAKMAEFAGWWRGRLEAEADHAVGFGSVEAAPPDPAAGSISLLLEAASGIEPLYRVLQTLNSLYLETCQAL